MTNEIANKEMEAKHLTDKMKYSGINGVLIIVLNIAFVVYSYHNDIQVSIIASVIGVIGGVILLYMSWKSNRKATRIKQEVNIKKAHE